MSGEHPSSGESRRISKAEAALGIKVAVQEQNIGELRRDIDRLEGALGEQRAQIEGIQVKAGQALTLASRPPPTGPHEAVPNNRKQTLAVGSGGVVGGGALVLLIQELIRALGGG